MQAPLLSAAVLFALVLCSCGGGGGGEGASNDPDNVAPQVTITSEATQSSGATVILSATASDVDGTISSVRWTQVNNGRPLVEIVGANQEVASFFAEAVNEPVTLRFQFTAIDDDGADTSRETSITLVNPDGSAPPVIQTPIPSIRANEGENVVLNVIATDPDGDGEVIRYRWEYVEGLPEAAQPLQINSRNDGTPEATFIAPDVDEPTVVTFRVTVTDNSAAPTPVSAHALVEVLPLPIEADDSDLYVLSSNGELMRYGYRPGPQAAFISDQNFGSFQLGGPSGAVINDAIRLLPDGRLIAIGDADTDGLREVCALPRRTAISSFDASSTTGYDRNFSQSTMVENYADITVALTKGYLITLDNFTNGSELRGVHVYGSTAASGTPPLVANIPLGPIANGVMYLEEADQLFVSLANGRIAIFDDFIAEVELARAGTEASETPGSSILADAIVAVRESADGSEIGVNPQGMAYHAPSDRLIIVDAGAVVDPANTESASDGQIFIIGSATSLADGGFGTNAVADAVLSIPSGDNRLGDPVSVVLNGRDAVVADAGNDRVVVIEDIFALDGDTPPVVAQTIVVTGPASLALRPLDLVAQPSVNTLGTDQASLVGEVASVLTTQFDSANGQMRIQRLSSDLDDLGMVPSLSVSLGGGRLPARLALDVLGNAYAVSYQEADVSLFDPLTEPGVTHLDVVNSAAKNRLTTDGTSTQAFRDRTIVANEPDAEVENPFGVTIIDELGVMLIADGGGAGPAGIKVVSLCGVGATLGANIPVEGNIPTDVDFDSRTGNLYVSLAANAANSSVGRFAIYQNFSSYLGSLIAGSQDNTPPNPSEVVSVVRNDGLSTPAAAGYTAIEYIPGADLLVLATNTQDQQATVGGLHVIRSANLAPPQLLDGQTFVDAEITGADTLLQDPVDLAFDGTNLFVAELGNGRVLSFSNVTQTPGGNVAPQAERDAVGVRGVVPVPGYVGTVPQRVATP